MTRESFYCFALKWRQFSTNTLKLKLLSALFTFQHSHKVINKPNSSFQCILQIGAVVQEGRTRTVTTVNLSHQLGS